MKVAIVQSNFLPWRGYFDIINRVDKFILYDCVQYTKNDWRNRNKILSKNGEQWLTLPVVRPQSWCKINEVYVENKMLSKAIRSLEICYGKAPNFSDLDQVVLSILRTLSQAGEVPLLSTINKEVICSIVQFYNLKGKIISLSEIQEFQFLDNESKSSRLLRLMRILQADSYLSGPNAKEYLHNERNLFEESGISVEYIDYPIYSQYKQFKANVFVPGMSVADFIAHAGKSQHITTTA